MSLSSSSPSPFFVDPARCRPWRVQPFSRGRATPETCADLIDSIRAAGAQEIPAIVRALPEPGPHDWEIICGVRRHCAVTHLRDQGADIGFLVMPRDLNDRQAFHLADLENRTRKDISELARAMDYAHALESYHGGSQQDLARALGVSAGWLSRLLRLARLPGEIIAAFPDPADLRERHARRLAPLLADTDRRAAVLAEAGRIAEVRATGVRIPAEQVLARLCAAGGGSGGTAGAMMFRRSVHDRPVTMRRRGQDITLRFPRDLSEPALRGALEAFLIHAYR